MKKKNGFTLIELLVVIVIIGILAAVGLGSYTSGQLKARDGRRKSDLKNIGTALEVYYNDKREYPQENNGEMIACGSDGTGICDPLEPMTDGATIYMVQVPGDPKTESSYSYESDGTYYRLYAYLENTEDPQIKAGGYVGTDCGGLVCNYGISSSNVAMP